MPFYSSIRNRRNRKRLTDGFGLQLTAMLDILVVILIFLLKSYQTSTHNFITPAGMELPESASPDSARDSLHVVITPEGITFEDERILDFRQTLQSATEDATYEFIAADLDEGGRRILPLFDALMKARRASEILREKSKVRDENGNPLPFEGVLAIQADKRIDYNTLRKVMYTAASAGYKVFRFLALKRREG